MTNTNRKFEEARYFLGQLNIDDPYFDYILSAYLNAARSITWIMRHEFGQIEGWEEWFKTCDVSNDKRTLLKTINELRIKATKQEGVKTDYYLLDGLLVDEQYYPIIKELLKTDGDFKITIQSEDEINNKNEPDQLNEGSFVFEGRINRARDNSENPRLDLYKLCNDYFEFLQIQVNTCILKFR